MRYGALLDADAEALLPHDREHVTPFIRSHPERFMSTNVRSQVDFSSFRWTVDGPEDLEFVKIYLRIALSAKNGI